MLRRTRRMDYSSQPFLSLCSSHNLEHDSIASVREEGADGNFRTLSGNEIRAQQGQCLVRVPTVAPILNRRWFLEEIAKSRERHAQEKALRK